MQNSDLAAKDPSQPKPSKSDEATSYPTKSEDPVPSAPAQEEVSTQAVVPPSQHLFSEEPPPYQPQAIRPGMY